MKNIKDLDERTARVLSLAEYKTKGRARKRRFALAFAAPLALILCAAAVILPSALGKRGADNDDKQADSSPIVTLQPTESNAATDEPVGTELPPEPTATPEPTPEPMPTAKPIDLPVVNLGTVDLMRGVAPGEAAEPAEVSTQALDAYADFALRLFRAAQDGENELISPLSILCALSMTANGAEGETLAEMERVLGMTREELNDFWRNSSLLLPAVGESRLELANSVWFKSYEGFNVNEEFLQTNADIYKADVFKAPFDESTLDDINGWVNEKTDHMITRILDEIPEDAIMYLINALSFNAEWEKKFHERSVHIADFTLEDGEVRRFDVMDGGAEMYLSDDNAEGFIKYYKGRQYAFAALLPDEGVSVAEYVASLDGERLLSILKGAEEESVIVGIPMIETEYSNELSGILYRMGIKRAFTSNAEFGALGTLDGENVCIGEVLHKTFICLDTGGTRAGAITAVSTYGGGGSLQHYRVIRLDRPFVYMLIDCETNLPFFIGTLMDPMPDYYVD